MKSRFPCTKEHARRECEKGTKPADVQVMVDTSMIFRNTPYSFLSLSPLLVSLTSIDAKDSMLDAAANSIPKETPAQKTGGNAAAPKAGGSTTSKADKSKDATGDGDAKGDEDAGDGEGGEEEALEDDIDVS